MQSRSPSHPTCRQTCRAAPPPRRHKFCTTPIATARPASKSVRTGSVQMLEQGHSRRKFREALHSTAACSRRSRRSCSSSAVSIPPAAPPALPFFFRFSRARSFPANRRGCGVMVLLFFFFFFFFFHNFFFLSLSRFSLPRHHLSWHTGVLSNALLDPTVYKALDQEACRPGTYDTQYDIFGCSAACLTRCDML